MGENSGGILLDIFPPLSWDEKGVALALEITNETDPPGESWGFTDEEIRFLASCVAYYRANIPEDQWGDNFSISLDVDPEDPDEDGRIVIDMAYPPHLEPPASLR